MELRLGNGSEYRKLHDEIWPEVSEAIHDAGISNDLFFDQESLTLCSVQKQ